MMLFQLISTARNDYLLIFQYGRMRRILQSKAMIVNPKTCSPLPDKPAKNLKYSAMIDAIANSGESPKAAPKNIFQTKKIIPAKKIDYFKMIG